MRRVDFVEAERRWPEASTHLEIQYPEIAARDDVRLWEKSVQVGEYAGVVTRGAAAGELAEIKIDYRKLGKLGEPMLETVLVATHGSKGSTLLTGSLEKRWLSDVKLWAASAYFKVDARFRFEEEENIDIAQVAKLAKVERSGSGLFAIVFADASEARSARADVRVKLDRDGLLRLSDGPRDHSIGRLVGMSYLNGVHTGDVRTHFVGRARPPSFSPPRSRFDTDDFVYGGTLGELFDSLND